MDLYNKKKAQLQQSTPAVLVNDAANVLTSKRSQSPLPRCTSAGGGASATESRKVLYKHEAEQLRTDMALQHSQLKSDVAADVGKAKADVAELRLQLTDVAKSVENSKATLISDAVSASVIAQNKNLETIASELVSIMDKLHELESRIVSIEGML